jgi:hypothetical protein
MVMQPASTSEDRYPQAQAHQPHKSEDRYPQAQAHQPHRSEDRYPQAQAHQPTSLVAGPDDRQANDIGPGL